MITIKQELAIKMFNDGKSLDEIQIATDYTREHLRKFLRKKGLLEANNKGVSKHLQKGFVKENLLKANVTRKEKKILSQKIDYIMETQNEMMRLIRLLYDTISTKKKLHRMIQ